jgi:tRNA threonylcarbamoyl adenosine modification protein YeaZ
MSVGLEKRHFRPRSPDASKWRNLLENQRIKCCNYKMKNIIAISACLKRCSLAVSYDNRLYEINENVDAATNLVWLADNLVKSNGIDLHNINGVITISGPGSFTGIRVAQSFAKGLALTLKLPSASVSYFDVINFHRKGNSHDAGIVIRSEKNQVYYQIDGEIGISPPELIASKIEGKTTLTGDAIEMIIPHLKNKIPRAIPFMDFRNAKYLLDLSGHITQKSKVHPLYITHTDRSKALNFQS